MLHPRYYSGSLLIPGTQWGFTKYIFNGRTGLAESKLCVANCCFFQTKLKPSQPRSSGACLFIASHLTVILGKAAMKGHMCTLHKGAIHNDVSVNVPLVLEQHGGPDFRPLNFPWNISDPDINYINTFKDI